MKAVCLIDTSVLYEFLIERDEQTVLELESKILGGDAIFLPMATIVETGNHIGRIADGGIRRRRAMEFAKQIALAVAGESPFTPIDFLEAKKMQRWINEFPDWALQGRGLGDLSIMHDWQRLCEQNPGRRVYIWSLDAHLGSYDQHPQL
jgi:predicted nucleic acid-binding protein